MKLARIASATALVVLINATLSGAQGEPKQQTAIGVARFAVAGEASREIPSIAGLLARRLGTLGVERVVEITGRSPVGAVDEGQIRGWAAESEVDAIVIGKTTRLGNRLSFDGQLRSGATGERIGNSFFVEAPSGDDLAGAADLLAKRVLAQVGGDQVPGAMPPEESSAGGSGPNLLPGRGDEPISINSDEFEMVNREGARELLFKGNVVVVQGDMKLTSHQAQAFYPPDASQPDRLIATGRVVMRSGGRVAHCDSATFMRAQNTVICAGSARIDDGCDRITGREIHFNTKSEKFSAKGDVQVRMNRDDPQCAQGAS